MGLFSGLLKRGGVKFVRKYSETKTVPQTGQSGVVIYEVYKAHTAQEAREFLGTGRTVTERLYYVVVETPEGN